MSEEVHGDSECLGANFMGLFVMNVLTFYCIPGIFSIFDLFQSIYFTSDPVILPRYIAGAINRGGFGAISWWYLYLM